MVGVVLVEPYPIVEYDTTIGPIVVRCDDKEVMNRWFDPPPDDEASAVDPNDAITGSIIKITATAHLLRPDEEFEDTDGVRVDHVPEVRAQANIMYEVEGNDCSVEPTPSRMNTHEKGLYFKFDNLRVHRTNDTPPGPYRLAFELQIWDRRVSYEASSGQHALDTCTRGFQIVDPRKSMLPPP